MKTNTSSTNRAFTVMELLTVVGIISLLGTMGFVATTLVSRAAQVSKLESDVHTLNSAISIYLANGGDLTAATTETDVLNKLKTTRSTADQKLHTGAPSGRMIDPRTIAISVAATDWKKRAQYNTTKQRFEIATTDVAGVIFDLDENLNEMSIPVETRTHGIVNYAQTKSWVWDHGALVNPNSPNGPSKTNTGNAPPNSDPGAGDGGTDPEDGGGDGDGGGGDPGPGPGPETPPAPPLPRLPYPAFNLAGGGHLDTEFPLDLTLTNVPDASIGEAIVQIGSGGWAPYSGSISVPMNSWIRAQYRAVDPTTHQDSWTNSQYFYPIASSLAGSVSGTFKSPEGGTNLDTSFTDEGTFFSNGNPTVDLGGEIIDAGEPNTLRFQKSDIGGVAPGEQFKIGDLFYHNGTTFNDSHATGVTLQISINLQNPAQTLTFDLVMDLVNTDNTQDDASSADYVKLTNLTQAIPLNINGVGYQIQLEFGITDSNGFASSSQFHVYEGATGQGEIRATFLAKP